MRAKPVNPLSPVATAHRPTSMLIHICRKTPSTAAHIMVVPNFAVIHGQSTISPEPMARPIMMAPGPASCQNERLRAGTFSEPSFGIGIGIVFPLATFSPRG